MWFNRPDPIFLYNLDYLLFSLPIGTNKKILFVLQVTKFQANHSGMAGLTVEAYRKLATNPTYVTPPYETYDELEDMYWDKLIDETSVPPIYGADVCESITDKVSSSF